jgi:hypothetical protein
MRSFLILLILGSGYLLAEGMGFDRIGEKHFYTARIPDAKGVETQWAAEFIDNKDTAAFYKVDGTEMKAAGSTIIKVNFPATAQNFEYFVTSDKRPIFVMELRDRVHDNRRHLYIFDPVKKPDDQSGKIEVNTDKFEMKMANDVLSVEYYDSDIKDYKTQTWKAGK